MSELPEPADGAMVVTCESSGVIRAWWRDDATTAEADWEGQPGEHWFDDADSDPMGWDQVLKYADTVHRVQAEAMGAAGSGCPSCAEALRATKALAAEIDARRHEFGPGDIQGRCMGHRCGQSATSDRHRTARVVLDELTEMRALSTPRLTYAGPGVPEGRHQWEPAPGGGWNCGALVADPRWPDERCGVIWSDRTRHYQDGENRG